MRKADCTPEQWQKYLAQARANYARNREARIEACKAYNQTDKAKARRRSYDMRPDVKARRREREQGENYKQRKREKWAEIKADPNALAEQYARTREFRTGMDRATFDRLLISQNGKCAICDRIFDVPRKGSRQTAGRNYPCADHCHDGGGPRGLLCHNCNTIEGHVRSLGFDLVSYMQRLHAYLEKPPAHSLQDSLLCVD